MAVSNKENLREIRRHASEMAFCLRLLAIDENNVTNFQEQTIAKNNAEEWLKKFQEDEQLFILKRKNPQKQNVLNVMLC